MPKYLITYHGGATPDNTTEEERNQIMAAWQTWMGGLGDSLLDPGNPTSQSKLIRSNGSVEDTGDDRATGYTLLNAADMDDALAKAKGCPHLESGGSIGVHETFDM